MLPRHYLEQGGSKSALARQLGISRDTLHRWIRDGDLDRDLEAVSVRYGPRPAVPTKLDPFKAVIEDRLAAYPDLSAVRLLDEIRAAMGGNALADSSALIPTATFQPFTVAGVPGTYATLTFQRSNIHEDFSQHVEFSSDLGTWPLTGVQVSSADNGNGTRTEVWRSSIPVEAGARLFGRVRFTQP